jgi:hypothetical protein
VHRDFVARISVSADEGKGAVNRVPPLGTGLGREAPSLAVRRGRGRPDVAGLDHVRVPSQGPVDVFLHAREMTDQALNVQPAQRELAPVRRLQDAEHPVEGVRRAAERLRR